MLLACNEFLPCPVLFDPNLKRIETIETEGTRCYPRRIQKLVSTYELPETPGGGKLGSQN